MALTQLSQPTQYELHDPDVRLMLQVRDGDAAAFTELVLRYQNRLLTVLEHLVGTTGALWAKTIALTPTKVLIGVVPAGDLPGEDVNCMPDNNVHNAAGEPLGSVKELVDLIGM